MEPLAASNQSISPFSNGLRLANQFSDKPVSHWKNLELGHIQDPGRAGVINNKGKLYDACGGGGLHEMLVMEHPHLFGLTPDEVDRMNSGEYEEDTDPLSEAVNRGAIRLNHRYDDSDADTALDFHSKKWSPGQIVSLINSGIIPYSSTYRIDLIDKGRLLPDPIQRAHLQSESWEEVARKNKGTTSPIDRVGSVKPHATTTDILRHFRNQNKGMSNSPKSNQPLACALVSVGTNKDEIHNPHNLRDLVYHHKPSNVLYRLTPASHVSYEPGKPGFVYDILDNNKNNIGEARRVQEWTNPESFINTPDSWEVSPSLDATMGGHSKYYSMQDEDLETALSNFLDLYPMKTREGQMWRPGSEIWEDFDEDEDEPEDYGDEDNEEDDGTISSQ